MKDPKNLPAIASKKFEKVTIWTAIETYVQNGQTTISALDYIMPKIENMNSEVECNIIGYDVEDVKNPFIK